MKTIKLASLTLLLLLLIPLATAIGIAPSKLDLPLGSPPKNYTFLIINNEHKDLTVEIGVESLPEAKVHVNKFDLRIAPDKYETAVLVTIELLNNASCGTIAKVYALEKAGPSAGEINVVGKVLSRVTVTGCENVPKGTTKIHWIYYLTNPAILISYLIYNS